MGKDRRKIIGTLAPLNSLHSRKYREKSGTIETGMLFLDWLAKTGQSAWQMLPLYETHLEPGSKTKHAPSPYKGYGVGLDPRYLSDSAKKLKPDKKLLEEFVEKHKDWIEDYALFCALRDYYGTDDWGEWEDGVRGHDENALEIWRDKLSEGVDYHIVEQWRLHYSYGLLRKKACGLKIQLIGDLPFYIPFQSPLTWKYQDLFDISSEGSMEYVSGIPDYSREYYGRQVWGHPLYKWDKQKIEITYLWKLRINYIAGLFDFVRLDHSMGFYIYGLVNTVDESRDQLKQGPGEDTFIEILQYSRNAGLNIIAEDIGGRTNRLSKAMRNYNIPGVRIFMFAVSKKLKDRFSEYFMNAVAYTSTHDSVTLYSFVSGLDEEAKERICEYIGVKYNPDNKIFTEQMRKAVIASQSKIIIIPIQDWLLSKARINVPGTEKKVGDTNWQYRVEKPIEDLPDVLW